jgi:hypothetical protein
MTLRLLLGCNLVNLLGTRLVTLLLVAGLVAQQVMVVAAVQVGFLLLQHLFLAAQRTQLLLAQVALL